MSWENPRHIIKLTIYSVVSLALGRPFAIQDDDITVEVCYTNRVFD